jgi:hypothetical protein
MLVAVSGDAEAYGIELAIVRKTRAVFGVTQIAQLSYFGFFELSLLVSGSGAVALPSAA